jgi:hypothetical protein
MYFAVYIVIEFDHNLIDVMGMNRLVALNVRRIGVRSDPLIAVVNNYNIGVK